MKGLRGILPLILLTALAACGGSNEQTPSASSPAAAPEAESLATETEAVADTPAAEETVATALESVEESAGEDAETTDETDELVLARNEPEAESRPEPAWQFSEGSHFTVFTTAQGTSSPPDKIEVAEMFWYGCPHCFNFDPYLESWKSELPDDVSFIRIPVMWNPTNQIHARIFFTAEALGKLDEMHKAIFQEMHQKNKTLTDEAEIRGFFANFGVSAEEFDGSFRSFAVESKLKRARNLTQRYQVRSVPLLVINGKYVVTGPEVKNFDDMMAVSDELVERERQRL